MNGRPHQLLIPAGAKGIGGSEIGSYGVMQTALSQKYLGRNRLCRTGCRLPRSQSTRPRDGIPFIVVLSHNAVRGQRAAGWFGREAQRIIDALTFES